MIRGLKKADKAPLLRGVLLLLFAFVLQTRAAGIPHIIPLPEHIFIGEGEFVLCGAPGAPVPSPTRILADSASRQNAEYLANILFKSTGYRFQISDNDGAVAVPNAIVLTTNYALGSLGSEGYELTVTTNTVLVRAPAPAGVFYGIQTLLQLLPPQVYSPRPSSGVSWSIAALYVKDKPRFPWRGFMLDSVRHFFNMDEVKQLIDSMAMHKLNVFHWHLDDDSGWRLEIKKWPLLTQSAWRTDLNPADPNYHLWNLNPRSSTAWREDGMYGGFYTQDQAREIVQYAAQRHITVVPEIEMPGHSTSALAAYPQFACGCSGCYNGPYSLNVTSYIGGVFCIARPETIAFLKDVLTEVMEIFPGQYIHIGGDEVRFNNWINHTLDREMTNALGASSMRVYQSHFTQEMADWIRSKGRTLIGWSEIYNGGLVTNSAVMDWLNTRGAQAATNRQYAVMAPSSTLYINKWETAYNSSGGGVVWSNEPPGQSGLCTLENVYAYEPIPAGVSGEFTNYILGAEGPCWSEWIPSLRNMQFRMFPRLSAIAELTWTPASLKDWTSFTNRLVLHKQRFDCGGINYNPHATPPEIGSWNQVMMSTNFAVLSWDITPAVTNAGEIDISFCYKYGAHGLDIAWVALIEDGVEIDRDTHAGWTGFTPKAPTYVLRLPAFRPWANYTLRASVASRGGTDSNGIIYRTPWN
jgi:hexosaminidase